MILHVINDVYDPLSSHMQMMMPVVLKELIDTSSVNASNLHQWGVGTGCIYVLLCFRFSAEGTLRLCCAHQGGGAFGKIDSVGPLEIGSLSW